MAATWKFMLIFVVVLASAQVATYLVKPNKPEKPQPSSVSPTPAPAPAPPPSDTEVAANATPAPQPQPVEQPPKVQPKKVDKPAPAAPPSSDPKQVIVDLYRTGKLFRKEHYAEVRAAFANHFARQHASEIRLGLDVDYEPIIAWLQQRPGFTADLFTAMDEWHDNLAQAFGVFRRLWRWSPQKVEMFPDLAIAMAVVWDKESTVYDTAFHRQKPRALATGPLVGDLGNFQYLVEHDSEMLVRLTDMPWEVLTYVVDHRTPLAERAWARKYANPRRNLGWYLEVPYDNDLLNNKKAKLAGHEYSLSNILNRGGVCLQRADFAARVGKSVGVPSLVCYAFLRNGNPLHGHAYSSHLQIVNVQGDRIDTRVVTLVRSTVEGFYYTGKVTDPQSNMPVNDRDVERYWWMAAQDRVAKRQAALAMRGYLWMKDEYNLSSEAKCDFLERCLRLSFFNEWAWVEFGRMAKDEEFPGNVVPAFVKEHLANLPTTAAAFPDFILPRYDALLPAYADVNERIELYSNANRLFEKLGRRDLAADAQQRIAKLQR